MAGTSAAYQISKLGEGLTGIVLEAGEEPANIKGSSYGESRMFRQMYRYVPEVCPQLYVRAFVHLSNLCVAMADTISVPFTIELACAAQARTDKRLEVAPIQCFGQ